MKIVRKHGDIKLVTTEAIIYTQNQAITQQILFHKIY